MLCLCGFELCSRWVPLIFAQCFHLLRNYLFHDICVDQQLLLFGTFKELSFQKWEDLVVNLSQGDITDYFPEYKTEIDKFDFPFQRGKLSFQFLGLCQQMTNIIFKLQSMWKAKRLLMRSKPYFTESLLSWLISMWPHWLLHAQKSQFFDSSLLLILSPFCCRLLSVAEMNKFTFTSGIYTVAHEKPSPWWV